MSVYCFVWNILSMPFSRFQCWSVDAAWKYTHSTRFTYWVMDANNILWIPFRHTNPY